MWEPERRQGARWLGRRASEKTSWRRQESQVGWSRREECGRYLRWGCSLGRGMAGERTGGAYRPQPPSPLCFSSCDYPLAAHGSLLRWHSAPTAGGALGAPTGAILLRWPQGHTAQPGWLGAREMAVWGRGSTRRLQGSGHQLVRPVFHCPPGCEPRTWNSRRTQMTTSIQAVGGTKPQPSGQAAFPFPQRPFPTWTATPAATFPRALAALQKGPRRPVATGS